MKDQKEIELFAKASETELMAHDKFISWVLEHKHEDFWKEVMEVYPEQEPVVKRAHQMLLNLKASSQTITPTMSTVQSWKELENKRRRKSLRKSMPRVAAVAALLLIVGAILFVMSKSKRPFNSGGEIKQWSEITNTEKTNKQVELEDGSLVELYPGSKIIYPHTYNESRRVLKLEGDAYFEISRDTTRPFVIYSNQTLVKVLGTSFTIRSNDRDEVEVSVNSGTVAVYSNDEATHKKQVVSLKPIIINANQKSVHNLRSKVLTKEIITNPLPTIPIVEIGETRFENAPLYEILDALQRVYGININYDKEVIAECFMTTTMTNASLFEKLNILFSGTSLKYYQNNGNIYVTGIGC